MTNNDDLALKLKQTAQLVHDNEHISNYGKLEAWKVRFRHTASPANILALLAERTADKAENSSLRQRVAELEGQLEVYQSDLCDTEDAMHLWAERAQTAENRIAKLEARTPNVNPGEVLVTVSGFTGCGKSAIAGEIEIAMRAIGVPVTWSNGDAEKRMTGADWLTAIEMYKPTVRIVEINVPRTGIKLEVEE